MSSYASVYVSSSYISLECLQGDPLSYLWESIDLVSRVTFHVSLISDPLLKNLLLVLQVLKETLVRHGFTFESDTDTEVIPKLAKFVFDRANEDGKIS